MRLHVEDSSKTKGEFENVDKVEMVIELNYFKLTLFDETRNHVVY